MFKSKTFYNIFLFLIIIINRSYSNVNAKNLHIYVKDEESKTKNQKGVILKDIFDWTSLEIINAASTNNKICLELGGGSGYITEQIAFLRKQKFGSTLELDKKLYFNDLSELHIQEAQKRISSELGKQIVYVPGHMEKILNNCNQDLNKKVSYCLARRTLHFVEGQLWPIIFQYIHNILETGGIFSILTGSYYIRNLTDNIDYLDEKTKIFNSKLQKLVKKKNYTIQDFTKEWNEMINSFMFDSKYAYSLDDITGPTTLINIELLEIISKFFGFEIIKSEYLGLNHMKVEDRDKLAFLQYDGKKEMVAIMLAKK